MGNKPDSGKSQKQQNSSSQLPALMSVDPDQWSSSMDPIKLLQQQLQGDPTNSSPIPAGPARGHRNQGSELARQRRRPRKQRTAAKCLGVRRGIVKPRWRSRLSPAGLKIMQCLRHFIGRSRPCACSPEIQLRACSSSNKCPERANGLSCDVIYNTMMYKARSFWFQLKLYTCLMGVQY